MTMTKEQRQVLDAIRKEANGRNNVSDRGYQGDRTTGIVRDTERMAAGARGIAGVEETNEYRAQPLAGTYSRDGQDTADGDSAPDSNSRRTGRIEASITPEADEERQKELHRQRQKRYSDRKKARQSADVQAQNISDSDTSRQDDSSDYRQTPAHSQPVIQIKDPYIKGKSKTADAKLFTKTEAEAATKKLAYMYIKLSAIGDDILEIVTKDHEAVSIWELSEDEAIELASMHLEQAQIDKAAARSARSILSLYSKAYILVIVYPRIRLSMRHVKEHHGFSIL